MDTKIVTKFTVVTEQGMDALLFLTKAIAIEKFSNLLGAEILETYIAENFSEKTLIVEVNSMSNQWLVVYSDDEPAGYARITSKGKRPERLDRKRIIRIADFGILKKYADPAIRQSLFDKCMSVCKPYDAIWVNEYKENLIMDFLETEGFVKEKEIYGHDELPLQSVCLIKEQR
nr:N-acetyltransferase [Pedobacter sp. ASV2]